MAEYETHPLARSEPKQEYAAHIEGVRENAKRAVESIASYLSDAQIAEFLKTTEQAAIWHDLGKLAKANQDHLYNGRRGRLPLDHQDAGAAYFNQDTGADAHTFAAPMFTKGHHSGLQNYYRERSRLYKGEKASFAFRSFDPDTLDDTQEHLGEYVALHKKELKSQPAEEIIRASLPDLEVDALLYRIMLSCLVDADHKDSAKKAFAARPACRWEEWLKMLKERRSCALKKEAAGEDLDRQIYDACCEAEIAPMAFLDAPMDEEKIGTLMAYGLRAASIGALKHVFLVVPKKEDVARFAVAIRAEIGLAGEEAAKIVVGYNANIEITSDEGLASLWRAPVIVLPLKDFYETVSAAAPKVLRKLREVVGSAILFYDSFSDEQRWKWSQELEWLKILSGTCGCRVLLQADPMVRFWEFSRNSPGKWNAVLPCRLQQRLSDNEKQRVAFRFDGDKPILIDDFGTLAELVLEEPGPRLVVLNTEGLAKQLEEVLKSKGETVYLALSPDELNHKSEQLKKEKLNAQHCATLVSAGIIPQKQGFTFAAGFVQLHSISRLLQIARVVENEHAPANLYTFEACIPGAKISEDDYRSGIVFREMLKKGKFQKSCRSDLLSEAIRTEAMFPPYDDREAKLKRNEQMLKFKQVSALFSESF